MLLSIAIILLAGVIISFAFEKVRIPALLGMLVVGILLNFFGLIDSSIMNISSELRKIALIIILLKAGLSLDFSVLKKVGRPAILMCFLPATFEIIALGIFGPLLLNLSLMESLLIGAVLGAVSPAVVIPRMTNFIEKKVGTDKGIPQMIIAGASADDVYCIVLFTAFTSLVNENNTGFNPLMLLQIPSSIILGILFGIIIGLMYVFLFKKIHMRDTIKLVILISMAFIMCYVEEILANSIISISSLLSVITMGLVVFTKRKVVAERLTNKCNKLWVVAEIFLFILVGASVKIQTITSVGISVIILLFIGLLMRMLGTFVCLIKTNLNIKERSFVMIAEVPKATVQAAIGGTLIGLNGINQDFAYLVLAISVLSIVICAPLGAFGIDLTYKKLLTIGNE
jgi:NhaP-type Na+/H+ or K+/H+ antiporter